MRAIQRKREGRERKEAGVIHCVLLIMIMHNKARIQLFTICTCSLGSRWPSVNTHSPQRQRPGLKTPWRGTLKLDTAYYLFGVGEMCSSFTGELAVGDPCWILRRKLQALRCTSHVSSVPPFTGHTGPRLLKQETSTCWRFEGFTSDVYLSGDVGRDTWCPGMRVFIFVGDTAWSDSNNIYLFINV